MNLEEGQSLIRIRDYWLFFLGFFNGFVFLRESNLLGIANSSSRIETRFFSHSMDNVHFPAIRKAASLHSDVDFTVLRVQQHDSCKVNDSRMFM